VGETAPRRVRIADEAVGEALEQRVETVAPGEPDEPHEFGLRAEVGEATRERIARRATRRSRCSISKAMLR
jgi:hypothetical protein